MTLVLVGGLMLYAVATGRVSLVTSVLWDPSPRGEGERTLATLTPAPGDGPAYAATPTIAVPDPRIVDDTAIDPSVETPPPAAAPSTVVAALPTPGTAETARPATPAQPLVEADGPAEPEPERPIEDGTPVLDLVRVTRDGSAVVAGTATPGAEVELLVDGVTVGRGTADARGSFAIVTEIGRLDAPRALQVRVPRPLGPVAAVPDSAAADGTATAGDPVAFATVAVASGGRPAPDAPEPARGDWLVSAPVVILPPDGPDIAGTDHAAPTLVEADVSGVVLQPPSDAPAERMILDAITYNTAGDAVARGRAPAGALIRVYVNNRALAETTAPESGDWVARLPEAEAQIARVLRFDEIAP
ncbi:MAG: hypothetical protein AAF698_02990, partial [Pseudomonadota bacterium]